MADCTLKDGRKLTIRLAADADMAELAETFRLVASEKRYLATETVPPETSGRWSESWKENGKDFLFLAGTIEGRHVGGLVLTRASNSPKSEHVRNLGMWVLKEYRGIGAGSSLMDAAIGWSRERKIRKITLGVFANNIGAMRLYLMKGFRIEGCLKENALIDEVYVDEILMGLEL